MLWSIFWVLMLILTSSKNIWVSFFESNNRIWFLNASQASTVSVIYSFLNERHCCYGPWPGWKKIWKLDVPPRVKTFVWKLAHSKLPTCDIFYNLNFGPLTLCHFCQLVPKTATHIFWECPNTTSYWSTILHSIGLPSNFTANLVTGS